MFENWQDFKSYYEAHYVHLLNDLYENENLTEEQKRLIGFLSDDLDHLLNKEEGRRKNEQCLCINRL